MNEKELITTFLQNTYTKTQALKRLSLLREYLESLFFAVNKKELKDFLLLKSADPEDITAMASWSKDFYHSFSSQNFYHLLDNLSNDIQNIPIVTLYLSLNSNESDIAKIGLWFRKNISPQVLLEIRQDKDRITGAAFVYNNHFYDYSLSYFMKKNKPEIIKLINQYGTNTH